MKKLVYLLLLTTTIVFSQTSGITYQAVLYNPNGEELPGYDNIYSPLTDQQVCLRFSIIDQNGDLEYMEEVTIMTDGFGMVNTIIGSHSQVDGYATGFNNIVWDGNPKSLKVDLDIKGQCTLFEELSNQPFTYVPFALYSANPGNPGPQGEPGLDGQDGVGIASTVDNNDGTFTINYTDGSSFTTADLTGPQGAQGIQGEQGPIGPTGATGPQGIQGPPGNDGVDGLNGTDGADGQEGVGIASTVDNNDGTFTINYTDGSSFTTADLTGPQGAQGIQGEQGPIGPTGATGPQGIQGPPGNDGFDGLNGTDGVDGQDGVGIASTVDNNDGTFTINYTDGSSFTTGDLTGPQGAQGIQGEQGPIGPSGATGHQGVQGPPGNDGADGLNGQDGTDGQDGVGIASTVDNNDGTFTINYTDGSSFTTADLTGPQGEQGPVGPTGLSGPQGVQGPPGNNGADGLNGQDGADGLSAYDVWLSLGNTGTDQDFIDFLTGTNGKNTLIKNTDEPSGSNCTNGGAKIEVGLDINSNGILDTGEVDSSLTKYICNGVNGTNLYSSFNWQIPDGLSNNIIPVNYIIAPTSPAYTCCSTPPSGWFNQAYIVPSGYNLYITNIRFGLGYNHGSLGIRINNVLVNGAVCSFNSSTPRIVGENMIVSFSQNGYSSSPCSGPIFANFQGFLVPKSVTVIYQTTQFIVPSNYKFIKYDTSAPLPTIYYSNNIVPANTNGYLVEN